MADFELNAAAVASLVVLVAALAVAVALVVYLARYWRSERANATAAGAVDEPLPPRELAPGESATLAELLEGGRNADPFLMRFVTDGATGHRAGESIAVHEERLIVKGESGGFVAVPFGKITVTEDDLVIAEDVNWEDAKRHAEAWQDASANPVEYDADGNPLR